MKTYLMIATAFSSSMSATAQNKAQITVPEAVQAAFAKQFPKAEGTTWELEDKTDYEAEFKLSGMKYSAKYDAKGTWSETEHKIKPEALPDAVKKAIAASYPEHKIKKAELAETPDGVVFEVDLEKGESELEVVFSTEGKLLKSTEEKEENGKGKEMEDDNDR